MILNLDADINNADWTKKGTWDLDIDNVEDLRKHLKNMRISIATFKTWPVYKWHVDTDQKWLRDLSSGSFEEHMVWTRCIVLALHGLDYKDRRRMQIEAEAADGNPDLLSDWARARYDAALAIYPSIYGRP